MALHRARASGSLALWLMKTFGLYNKWDIRVSAVRVTILGRPQLLTDFSPLANATAGLSHVNPDAPSQERPGEGSPEIALTHKAAHPLSNGIPHQLSHSSEQAWQRLHEQAAVLNDAGPPNLLKC
jgi:hypothetical protein